MSRPRASRRCFGMLPFAAMTAISCAAVTSAAEGQSATEEQPASVDSRDAASAEAAAAVGDAETIDAAEDADTAAAPEADDGAVRAEPLEPTYPVSAIDVGWATADFERWPFLRDVLLLADEADPESGVRARAIGDVMVPIIRDAAGVWRLIEAGDDAEPISFGPFFEEPIEPGTVFTAGALDAIVEALSAEHADRTLRVWIDPADIDPGTGRDLRREGEPLTFRYAWDGEPIEISRFRLVSPLEEMVPESVFADVIEGATVSLHDADGVWVAARPGPATELPLATLFSPDGEGTYGVSAVQVVLEAVRDAFVSRDWLGVRVRPAGRPFNALAGNRGQPAVPRFEDARVVTGGGPALDRVFPVEVLLAVARDIRTIGSSPDPDPGIETGTDIPRHRRFIRTSPVAVYGGPEWGQAEPDPDDPIVQRREATGGALPVAGPGDTRADGTPAYLIRRGELDDYLFRMSRYPGRRVDVAITPGPDATDASDPTAGAGVTLDYLISETKPLFLYGQASNTGTAQTDRIRYRFGLVHSQLTDSDDTLSLEFSTPDFDRNLAANASYAARVGDLDRLRWRVFGGWGQYLASEVGFFGQDFSGDSWAVGGELAWNFFQDREHFLDLIVGTRFLDARTEDPLLAQEGAARFIVPYLGLRYERLSDIASTNAIVLFEYSDGAWTNNDPDDLNEIGRLQPDEEWYKLRWDVSHAFYLEPVLDRAAWQDLSTPESSTLAHELAFRVRGQYAFDRRLIPQEEQVAGGLFTVRGYPESVSVGDTVVLATAEYRLHLPRLFGVTPDPGEDFFGRPFRAAPQFVLGPTDWDLIFRGFVDFAYTEKSDAFGFEDDETLLGAGVGVQLRLRNNVDVRVDWGFALEELEGRTESGSNRVHFLASLLF